jgi:hypothetical protein
MVSRLGRPHIPSRHSRRTPTENDLPLAAFGDPTRRANLIARLEGGGIGRLGIRL